MTWLAAITIGLAFVIFLVRQESKGTRNRRGEWRVGPATQSRPHFLPGGGDDMKKRKDADYCR
jgi:hypothetical protein